MKQESVQSVFMPLAFCTIVCIYVVSLPLSLSLSLSFISYNKSFIIVNVTRVINSQGPVL